MEECGGAEGEEVGDAANVVVVVVGEEGGGDGGGLGGEDGAEGGAPWGEALRCVDEKAGAACAEEVGVCALEGELVGPVSMERRGEGEGLRDICIWGRGVGDIYKREGEPFQDYHQGSGSR